MATFTNQASLSYNGEVISSNIVSGEVVEVLSVGKTSTLGTYTQGEKVTYAVSIVNSGTTPISAITLTDDLGAYTFDTLTLVPLQYVDGSVTYFVNGALQAAPTVTATSPLTIEGLSVPAGGNAVIIYETELNNYASGAQAATITNTATLSSPNLVAPITATETVTAADGAQLSLTKAVSPTTVNENGELTYTITVYNYGNADATVADNVVVNDTFDPILYDISATLDGTPLVLTTEYTYDTTTGVFATVAGVVKVPAATFTQNTETGVYSVVPGSTVLQITGTV